MESSIAKLSALVAEEHSFKRMKNINLLNANHDNSPFKGDLSPLIWYE